MKVSENRSMEIPILSACVKNIDTFSRQTVPRTDPYELFLESHGYLKDVAWVVECME